MRFIVYDYTENLSSLDGVTATVEIGDSYKGEFDFAKTKTANKFQLDLTSLVFEPLVLSVSPLYSELLTKLLYFFNLKSL